MQTTHPVRARVIFWILLAVMSVEALWVVVSSFHLRPSGDDYCFGQVVARCGILGGVVEWWSTWSGFASIMFFANLLVGFPLAKFSFGIASFIPFAVAALAVACSFLVILGRQNYDRYEAIVFVAVIACAWWGYLWLPYALHIVPDDVGLMAVGLTHWQTINGEYVVQTAVLLMLSVAIVRMLPTHPRWALALTTLLALETGFGGPAMALSAVLMVGVVACIYLRKGKLARAHIGSIVTFILICSLAALASVKWSPGSLYRATLFENPISMSFGGMWDIFTFTAFVSLSMWFFTFVNLGAVSSGLIVLTVSMLIRKKKEQAGRNDTYLIWSGYLCLFSLIQCVVNRLSEYVTYAGYWHYVTAELCSFLSIMLFSVWLARWILPVLVGHRAQVFVLSLSILAFTGNSFALHKMVQSMSDRKPVWEAGPASLPGLSDIDDATGWQMGCWKSLETHRQQIDPPGFRLPVDGQRQRAASPPITPAPPSAPYPTSPADRARVRHLH